MPDLGALHTVIVSVQRASDAGAARRRPRSQGPRWHLARVRVVDDAGRAVLFQHHGCVCG